MKSGALQFWHSCLVSGPVAHGACIADEAWVPYGSPFIEIFLSQISPAGYLQRWNQTSKAQNCQSFWNFWKDLSLKKNLQWCEHSALNKQYVPTQQTKVISLNSALSACERADEWQVGALGYLQLLILVLRSKVPVFPYHRGWLRYHSWVQIQGVYSHWSFVTVRISHQ